MKKIDVAKDFHRGPCGRLRSDSDYSGERFREEIPAPALNDGSVVVDFSGAKIPGTSFIEEVFGGLVRRHGFSPEEIGGRLTIIAPNRCGMIETIGSCIKNSRAIQNPTGTPLCCTGLQA